MRDFGRAVKTDKLMRGTTAFPAVNFSCAGDIFAWTAAGNSRSDGGDIPQLGTCGQPCPRESRVSFARSSRSELLRCKGMKCVHRFTLAQPLSFVENDILVIKQSQDLLEVFYSKDRQRRRRMPSRVRTLTNNVPLITLGKLMSSIRFHTPYCHTSTHSIRQYYSLTSVLFSCTAVLS